jgi:uncharacterized Zn finger protein
MIMSFQLVCARRVPVTINKKTIRDRCTDAVFERGLNYYEEGHIQRIERFDTVITAVVRGSQLYDVTIEVRESDVDPRCTCPYDGPGDCKHVVAVLLEVAANPPTDESERVKEVLEGIANDELRAFVVDALTHTPELRDQFLARFGDTIGKSAEEYRDEVDHLFEQHTEDYPVVVEAIDFSRFFDVAERYRGRDRYLAAATVYRGLFEGIDDNIHLVDAAYDHYAEMFQSALDGYVDCVLATDPDPEQFELYAGIVDERATTGTDIHRAEFTKALDELKDRR